MGDWQEYETDPFHISPEYDTSKNRYKKGISVISDTIRAAGDIKIWVTCKGIPVKGPGGARGLSAGRQARTTSNF